MKKLLKKIAIFILIDIFIIISILGIIELRNFVYNNETLNPKTKIHILNDTTDDFHLELICDGKIVTEGHLDSKGASFIELDNVDSLPCKLTYYSLPIPKKESYDFKSNGMSYYIILDTEKAPMVEVIPRQKK